MKKLLPFVPFLLVLPFAASAAGPAREARGNAPTTLQQDLTARVAALEEELAASKKKNDETRALLEQTLAYLETQVQGAKTLLTVLDESEREGFTPGINFRSRELMLAGFRAYWGGMQQGLPKVPPKAVPGAPQEPKPRQ